VELTVLGASGSYGAPAGGACSGYLVRERGTVLWLDCGNGTFANLQQHVPVADVDALIITHEHPDHCVDIYGLHIMLRFGLERFGLPVYGPEGLEQRLGSLVRDWGDVFTWNGAGDGDAVTIGDLAVRFSRTEHPPPTLAVELRGADKRLVYTSDTGPGWTVGAFDGRADLVISEATYQTNGKPGNFPWHLTAAEAGQAAREAGARHLMLTHLWPTLDPVVSIAEASETFGREVTLAAAHRRIHV
jgi:ribonuclease BN (tRNA processing enzyme)